jgi:hypothetical protein
MLQRAPLKADRFKDLEERFPPVDPATFLALQRKWVRFVNTASSLSHVERSAAIFIGMMCSPDRPFCVAGTDFICRQVGCERTAIYRACQKLRDMDLMEIESRKRAGNIYRISWPFA